MAMKRKGEGLSQKSRLGLQLLLALAVAATGAIVAASANPYWHHRRTSIYGAAPAYWGVERNPSTIRGPFGWRYAKLNPRDASVHQIDPRLRRKSDGHLLEELSGWPAPSEAEWIWLDRYGLPVIADGPRAYHRH